MITDCRLAKLWNNVILYYHHYASDVRFVTLALPFRVWGPGSYYRRDRDGKLWFQPGLSGYNLFFISYYKESILDILPQIDEYSNKDGTYRGITYLKLSMKTKIMFNNLQ